MAYIKKHKGVIMKERYQVTLNPTVMKHARALMKLKGYSSFSEFLESLIRAETERFRDLILEKKEAMP
jgi:hypothetical protein